VADPPHKTEFRATAHGHIPASTRFRTGLAGVYLGVGRNRTDRPDARAGMVIQAEGRRGQAGDVIMDVYGRTRRARARAPPCSRGPPLRQAPPAKDKLILKEITRAMIWNKKELAAISKGADGHYAATPHGVHSRPAQHYRGPISFSLWKTLRYLHNPFSFPTWKTRLTATRRKEKGERDSCSATATSTHHQHDASRAGATDLGHESPGACRRANDPYD
jgi:hypothetical protein